MSELCFLEQTASWHTVSCHWENISVEATCHCPAVESQMTSVQWTRGIWEHLTPPEEHPTPRWIKPGILTGIHIDHFQSLSWLMITEMANNHIGFSWLQKEKLTWHWVTPVQLPLTASCIHLLSGLESIYWVPKGGGSTRYGLLWLKLSIKIDWQVDQQILPPLPLFFFSCPHYIVLAHSKIGYYPLVSECYPLLFSCYFLCSKKSSVCLGFFLSFHLIYLIKLENYLIYC